MAKKCRPWIVAIMISIQCFSSVTKAAELRDFLMSCAYGTAAGALVGLATLAFSEDPSKNFSNVAKGASLGLYVGIGLGLYLAYGEGASSSTAFSLHENSLPPKAPSWALIPKLGNSGVEGLHLQVQMLQF